MFALFKINRLTFYIGKTLVLMIGLAMSLILSVDMLFLLVNEVRHVGTGDFNVFYLMSFMLFSLPAHFYQLFPMAALLGTLMGLGVMASHSELIVMRCAGMSIIDISKVVLKVALWLAILAWLIGEVLSPFSDQFAKNQKARALSGGQTLTTAHGTWMRDGEDFVHIRTLHMGGHLEGITRYEFNDDLKLTKSSFASYGDYLMDHWVLYDIQETYFLKDKVVTNHLSQEKWVSRINPEVLRVVQVKHLDKLSFWGLMRTIQYRKTNGLHVKPYEVAFWSKCLQPFTTLVMMLLAIPFIFGPLRQATMGLRMMTGILVGFGFHIFNNLFGNLSVVYPIPSFLGAALPTIVFLGIGLYLSRQVP